MATYNAAPKDHLPGVTTASFHVKVFDFLSAFDFVKGILKEDFLEEKWPSSLSDALRACNVSAQRVSPSQFQPSNPGVPYTNIPQMQGSYQMQTETPFLSCSWLSISFLNMLWDLLFGRTVHPSPWHELVLGLDPYKTNGSADQIIPIGTLLLEISRSPPKAEDIIRRQIGKFFPMNILMPSIITPTPPPTLPDTPSGILE
ncbi:hypothetical protein F4805DRAFT_437488 [Annulohypoxylon moriforme]|nr:hypothetical protein F4805DRAFT_437488 [Annulohypoxylon moriforme]